MAKDRRAGVVKNVFGFSAGSSQTSISNAPFAALPAGRPPIIGPTGERAGSSRRGMILLNDYGLSGLYQCPECGKAGERKHIYIQRDQPKTCKRCADKARRGVPGGPRSGGDYCFPFAYLLTEVWVACTGGGRDSRTWTLAACNVARFICDYGYNRENNEARAAA